MKTAGTTESAVAVESTQMYAARSAAFHRERARGANERADERVQQKVVVVP